MRSFVVKGQAAGSGGTVAPGTIVAVVLPVTPGQYLNTVRLNLREGSNSVNGLAPLGGGAVLVEMLLTRGALASATVWGNDQVRWKKACYVPDGDAPTFHPNVELDEDMQLVARVFCRDNIRATQVVVDGEYEVGAKDFGPEHDPFPFGDFSPGKGHRRSIDLTDQEAGTEWSLTVPTGLLIRPLHARCTLVSAAGGSTRVAQLNVTIDSNVHVHSANYGQAGGTTITYDWFKDVFAFSGNQWASSVGGIFPMGLYLLKGGDAIGSSTANFDAADNWGAPILLVEEWVIPQVAAS